MASSAQTRVSRSSILIASILVIGTLYVARHVLIPFALALLLSFLLAPLVSRVQRIGLRRTPAVVLVVVFGLSIVVAVGWLVASQVQNLAEDLPDYRKNIIEKVRSLRTSLVGSFGEASETIEEIKKEIATPPDTQPGSGLSSDRVDDSASSMTHSAESGPGSDSRNWGGILGTFRAAEGEREPVDAVPVRVVSVEGTFTRMFAAILGRFVKPLGTIAIATAFVVFMLIQREELRDRLIRLVGRGHLNVTTEALNDAASRVSRYLLVQVSINALTGVAIGTGLALIGVPNAPLWGLTAALLRFVPFIGPWIAAAMPILLSLAVFDDWLRPVLVVAIFLAVEAIGINVLEPWLYGAGAGASPIAILASAVFWTWLWGGVGLFLATPLTVCLVVVGTYVPQLEFLSVMLGDRPALPPHMRLYQRLLAADAHGCRHIVAQAQKGMTLGEVFDSIVVPALREAERDRRRRVLRAEREAAIHETVRGLIEEVGPQSRDGDTELARRGPSKEGQRSPRGAAYALCVPVGGQADELTALMLAMLLSNERLHARTCSAGLFSSELIEKARREPEFVACLCALPRQSQDRVRYLCKRLRKSAPALSIVVGIWTGTDPGPHETSAANGGDPVRSAGTLTRAVEILSAKLRGESAG